MGTATSAAATTNATSTKIANANLTQAQVNGAARRIYAVSGPRVLVHFFR